MFSVPQRLIYRLWIGNSWILDSASFGCSCVRCSMRSRLGGSCPGVDDRVRVLEISVAWFVFRDRYPATDRSRVSNIPGSYQDRPSWLLSGSRVALDRQSAQTPHGLVFWNRLTLSYKIKLRMVAPENCRAFKVPR